MCNLTNTFGNSSCSVRKANVEDDSDIFLDMNTFEISLCHKQHDEREICELLDHEFKPVANSKEHNDFDMF